MAGSGGGNATTEAAAHINAGHNLVLSGFGTGGDDWDTTVNMADGYTDNPSLLRFIISKGLTEVGGNPFEGITAFDVSELMEHVQERSTLLLDKIDAHDPEALWTAFISEAITQGALAVPELDVDTLVGAIVTAAITRAASMANDAVDKAEGDLEILPAIASRQLGASDAAIAQVGNSASNQAQSILTNLVANALTLVNSIKESPDDVIEALGILSGGEDGLVQGSVGTFSAQSRNESQLLADAVATDSTSSSQQTALIAAIKAEALAIAEDMNALTMEQVSSLNASAHSNAEFVAGQTLAGGQARVQERADATLARADVLATSQGALVMDAALPEGQAMFSPTENLIDGAATKASTLMESLRTASRTSIDSVLSSVNPNTQALIMQAIEQANFGASATIGQAISTALQAVDTDVVYNRVDSYRNQHLRAHLRGVNRLAGGMADINAVNSSAYILGLSMLESEYESTVATYQAELELRLYGEVLGAYIGQCAQNQATYLDGYLKHIALGVDVYRTELPIHAQVFTQIMPEYIRTFLEGFTNYLRVYLELGNKYGGLAQVFSELDSATYRQVYTSSSQAQAGLSQLQRDLFSSIGQVRESLATRLANIRLASYGETLKAQTDAKGSSERLGLELLQNGVGGTSRIAEWLTREHSGLMTNLSQAQLGVYSAGIAQEVQLFEQLIESRLRPLLSLVDRQIGSTVQARAQEASLRENFILNAVNAQDKLTSENIAFHKEGTALLSEVNRVTAILENEENDRNVDYDQNAATWDLELFQRGGNLVSAYSGSVTSYTRPSKLQSAVGGALSGAAMGASMGSAVPVIGTTIGAAGGAILGGVAGLL